MQRTPIVLEFFFQLFKKKGFLGKIVCNLLVFKFNFNILLVAYSKIDIMGRRVISPCTRDVYIYIYIGYSSFKKW